MTVAGLREILTPYPHLQIAAAVPTVRELLALSERIDLAILDLHGLPDASRPAENLIMLHSAGIPNVVVYTYGERRDLVQEAARSGAMSIISKTEPGPRVAEVICAAARGEPAGSIDWAAAIDADDTFRPRLSPRERQVLELYACGETADSVAELMQITTHSVHGYVKRIKAKYADVGRPAHTKSDLRRLGRQDGFL